MRIRFGLTTLALAMAILAGNNVRGQEYTPTAHVNWFYAGSDDMSDCCAAKQQGSDCCSQPCAKSSCCDKTKSCSGKKCCDKAGCCTGTGCSEGHCCPGCTGKADCPMCKAGKCCKGSVCKSQAACKAQQDCLLFPGIGLGSYVKCQSQTGCPAKSCRAMGCCAGAVARMIMPLPPMPVMMPVPLPPLPPEVVMSVVRLSLLGETHCPFCRMMGVCSYRPCMAAPVNVRLAVPARMCVVTRPAVVDREYAVEVRRMEKVGCEVCEKMACPRVTLEENQPVRVQIAGQLILGDAGLNCKDRTTAEDTPNQSMLDLLVRSCGSGKVCVGLETDQLQPPASGAEHGVGFRRCMRLIKTVELNKPTRVVLERGPKGSARSWLEVTVRSVEDRTEKSVKDSPVPSCTTEASEPVGPETALAKLKEWCKSTCPASCGNQVWSTMPAPVPIPHPIPSLPYAPAMLSAWQAPQPIVPPVPPVPTSALLPPPLPVASSPETMPPPAPIVPPAPPITPYGPPTPSLDTVAVTPPSPPAQAEPRAIELSVVEEKGKPMLRLETGAMRLTCEQITLETRGQGRITLCAGSRQVCISGKTLKARADRVKVEDANTYSLMGVVDIHTDLGGPGKGVVSETRGQGSCVRVNMVDGGISIRQVER